ncbi:CAAX amino terminal protease family [Belliella baltica DSM 15883]|uniref:CAAX amino terminal protease family n=1 Tax=Belliella baltica (strain DSM 15883 / CIP 108006 / LMG 21964 / BA134) TaxID=866536 RepID=I3Z6B5_BELBD|nr:CAAX amino terminal protease family [Belliella baltica DSM 15883]
MFIIIKDFGRFLVSKKESNQILLSNFKFLANALFLKWIIFSVFLLLNFLVFNQSLPKSNSVFGEDNIIKIFLNVVILAPILEELVFRYHIGNKLKHIVFSAIASIILFYDSLIVLSVLLLFFLILSFFLKNKIKVKNLILVYTSSIMFGVLHVTFTENFYLLENLTNSIFVFITKFFGGLLFCYVFDKKGIFLSIILHMLWNLVPFLLFFLRNRILEF